MALVALLALMLGSFAGLLIGRWAAVLPFAAAFPAAGLFAGPEVGAVGALAARRLLAGVHLHRVVAEQYEYGSRRAHAPGPPLAARAQAPVQRHRAAVVQRDPRAQQQPPSRQHAGRAQERRNGARASRRGA